MSPVNHEIIRNNLIITFKKHDVVLKINDRRAQCSLLSPWLFSFIVFIVIIYKFIALRSDSNHESITWLRAGAAF